MYSNPVCKLLLQVGGVQGPLLYCSASHLCQHHSVYLHVKAVHQHAGQVMYTSPPRQDRANTDCAACWILLHFVCHADAPECAQSPPCSQSAADQARYRSPLVLNSSAISCYATSCCLGVSRLNQLRQHLHSWAAGLQADTKITAASGLKPM